MWWGGERGKRQEWQEADLSPSTSPMVKQETESALSSPVCIAQLMCSLFIYCEPPSLKKDTGSLGSSKNKLQ